MAMILFSLTLSSSLIFCVHTAAPFFSVFIPSCLPCSGSLLTLCFFFVIWNIVLYRIIFHSLSLSLTHFHSQIYPIFLLLCFLQRTAVWKHRSYTQTQNALPSLSLSLLYGFVIIYILPLTISSNHCRIYKCVWHTMKSWNSKKKSIWKYDNEKLVFVDIWLSMGEVKIYKLVMWKIIFTPR